MTARPEASIVALSSVLNRIDKVKGVVPTVALTAAGSGLQTGKPIPTTAVAAVVEKSTDSTLEEGKDTPNELDADQKQAQVLHKALEDAVWYEFIDPTTSKAYYHCYATSETTWIKPSSFIAHNAYLGPSAGAADVSYKAYFNNANGRFSGQNYWEEKGVPQDRSARQLANFVDLKTLDQNREESRRSRALATQSRTGEQWAELNAQKKLEKKRKRDAWLLTEDDD